MIYPKFIKPNSKIAVTAPSDGITEKTKIDCFLNGMKNLKEKYNLDVFFTDNVFTSDNKGRSSSSFERASQFNDLVKSKKFDWIISATGGNYLVEILDYIDFEAIKENPVFIQGYSDNTSLLYAITTNCDIATIYGMNFSSFGMEKYGKPQIQNIELLQGKSNVVTSFEMYEDSFPKKITGLEYYSFDKEVYWKNAFNNDEVKIKGRLIGGCSDILFSLIGTSYDNTLNFIEKYKDDGIIFYLESFNTNDCDLYLHLWQMKKANYFKYCTGIIFGRPLFYTSYNNQTYQEVCTEVLNNLNIPLIFDADIGHKAPQIPIINGANALITSKQGKGKIEYYFD